MSHPSKENKSTLVIPIVAEKEGCPPDGGTPAANKHLSPEEEWRLNKAAVARFSRNGHWKEALELLTSLSKKQKTHEIYKALAQRVWVALKSDAPVTDVVLALYHLLNTLGPRHEIAGPVVALAHLMAKHRTPEHPDRALAQAQAQQMFALVLDSIGVVGEEAFGKWVAHNRLDDPNHYIPIVLNCLEIMVGDDWWIDRDALQRASMSDAAAKKARNRVIPVEKTVQ
ncbi:MAG: hypothetical protein HQL88_01955 [Magnetococcales bacterium]|nr:hypothetical protein [Magnetococcales bacterium]